MKLWRKKIMKAEIKKPMDIEEKRYICQIANVYATGPSYEDTPTSPYDYLRLDCTLDGIDDVVITVGFSFKNYKIYEGGELYNFLTKLGFKVNKEFDLNSLLGKRFSALIVKEKSIKNPEKIYHKIDKNSITTL